MLAGASANSTIASWSSRSHVTNTHLVANQAQEGGGMYIEHLEADAPTFLECTWASNNASRFGGALFVNKASVWPVRFPSSPGFFRNSHTRMEM